MGDELAKPNLLRETENAHSISTPSGGLAMYRQGQDLDAQRTGKSGEWYDKDEQK